MEEDLEKAPDAEFSSLSIEEDFLTLDTLPPEVFLHICSFLSAKFVINVLSNVCERFKDLIESDGTWKSRLFRRWPKKYPIVPDAVTDWQKAYLIREEHYDLWTNNGENMKMHRLKDAHFGAVNNVLLMEKGRICASAGRDGHLKLWNVALLKENFDPSNTESYVLHKTSEAQRNAWIWSLAYDEDSKIVYSGGFDNCLKSWDVSDLSVQLRSINLRSPIISLAYNARMLAAGSYSRKVWLYDFRSKHCDFSHRHHKKAVICVALDEKYIISGSEDKTVVVMDRRTFKVVATLTFEGFPLCMSYDSHQLYVGDVSGYIHVIDPNQDFKLLKSYLSGHNVKITGIQHSLGSVISCSTDKTIRIMEPNDDPKPIAVIKSEAEVSKISAYQTTLVSGNTDDSISFWFPKEDCS